MLIISPVSAAGCSRKGTDWDFPFRATDTLEFLAGDENDSTEPMQARMIVARNILYWMLVMQLSSDMWSSWCWYAIDIYLSHRSTIWMQHHHPMRQTHWIENLWNFNPKLPHTKRTYIPVNLMIVQFYVISVKNVFSLLDRRHHFLFFTEIEKWKNRWTIFWNFKF